MVASNLLPLYLQEIREQVCTRCVDKPPGGPPCAPLGKVCGVEMHLSSLIDSVREIHSNKIDPYLENNDLQICSHCAAKESDDCPCAMRYLAVLVVEAIEAVDQRLAVQAK